MTDWIRLIDRTVGIDRIIRIERIIKTEMNTCIESTLVLYIFLTATSEIFFEGKKKKKSMNV